MRKPVAWTHRLKDRTKREVHAYFSGGKIKWQFKRSDEEKWDHEAEPTMEDWESLLHYAEARYRRNRMPYEDIELIKKLTPKHC